MKKYFIPLVGLLFAREFDKIVINSSPITASRLILLYGSIHGISLLTLMTVLVWILSV